MLRLASINRIAGLVPVRTKGRLADILQWWFDVARIMQTNTRVVNIHYLVCEYVWRYNSSIQLQPAGA